MRHKEIEELEGEKFQRLTGVKKATFKRMVEILDEEDKRKKAKSGRKSKLCIEYLWHWSIYPYIFSYWTKLWCE